MSPALLDGVQTAGKTSGGNVMKIKNSKASGTAHRKIVTPTTPPNIKKILAPTDFSGQSLAGVRYAMNLRLQFGSSLILLHVIEPTPPMAGIESLVLAQSDSEVGAWALKELAKLARREAGDEKQVASLVRMGKPFHEITIEAAENNADLIVLTTHGYTGVEHLLLGSTAERVVRHAPCPVLTVPVSATPKRTGKTSPFKIKKILVPIDFSAISKGALPWASFLAAQFKAELVLVHVEEKFPVDYLLSRELMSRTMAPLIKQAGADLERLAGGLRKTTGANISAVVRDGKPFQEICHAAEAQGADLIVLTTHGHTGLKHVWLGSTAERVVRDAQCPVLVVRQPNRTPLWETMVGPTLLDGKTER
jgi:nucleotide-binding universal stress UspA family protein